MKEPFDSTETFDSSYIYNSIKSKKNIIWPKILVLLSIIFISLIIISIIIIRTSITEFEENKIEINCEYYIESPQEINILSKDFENISNISIYIGKDLVQYNIKHKFNKKGTFKVTYVLNKFLKMENMFKNVQNLKTVNISAEKGSFHFSLSRAFSNCTNLKQFYSNINPKNLNNLTYMFMNCTSLEKVYFENFGDAGKDLSHMFENCQNLKNLDLSNFKTNNTLNMSYMFSDCQNIEKIDISSFNISQIKDMSFMFFNCKNLENLNKNDFFIPNNNTIITGMFKNCNKLLNIPEWYYKKEQNK